MTKFSITTPIFYVNGPPHIGHAYSAVAADVLARAHRLPTSLFPLRPLGFAGQAELRGAGRGEDVFFLTGTDEHGAKIAEAAAAAGKPSQEFVDEISTTFKSVWKALDVQYDDFIRTTEPRHEAGVKHALQELHDRGFLYEKSYRGLYCIGCEKFLTEKDLDTEGKCPLHNRVPAEVEERNWFFKLSEFLPKVRDAIEKNDLRIFPEERRNEVFGLFQQGLEDFSVSRSRERVPWSIPIPFDETQTCYVWVDALLNYVTALGYGQEADALLTTHDSLLTRYWPADVQLVGQDILKFHAIYWPAILLALELPLPKEIFVHGFFTVNGQKISKSLGNAIDPLQLVQRYGSDATRFLLLSQFPFGASGDVQADRFDEQYDAILANTIGNLVSRTVVLLQKFSDSKIPDAPPDSAVFARSRSDEAIPASVADALDAIVNGPVRLAQELNQYADRAAPWKETDEAKRNIALRTLADGIVRLALLAEPLLPRTSATIQRAFGVSDRQLPDPGTPVEPIDPPTAPRGAPRERSGVLFPRVQ